MFSPSYIEDYFILLVRTLSYLRVRCFPSTRMYISPIVFTTFISYCLCHFPPCWLPRSLFHVPSSLLRWCLDDCVASHGPFLFVSHRLSWYSVLTRRDFSCEYTCFIVHSTPSPPYTYLNIVLFSFAYHALRSSFVCLYERKEIFSWVNGLHGFFCGITRHPPSLYVPASPCHVLVSVSFRSSPFFPHVIVFCTNVKRCLRE
jgi:hypothetical protein